MGNELLVKIQEKLGAILDLITFENIHQLVKYIAKYIIFNDCVPVTMVMMIFSIIGLIAIPKIYRYEKEKILDDYCDVYVITILTTTATILFTIFALVGIYQIIMVIIFPEISVINWLK